MTGTQKLVLLTALVGVLFLTAGVGSVAADAPDCSTVSYNGDGTEANPYEVGDVDQLQCINSQGLSANYVQVSDIDASGTSAWNGGNGFDPIGEFNTPFMGKFDGADHTISELTINRGSTDLVGLFGGLGSAGHLENVGVEKVDITGSLRVGGLVGNNQGTVRESHAVGSVSASGDSGAGGLVGSNDGTVKESYATGDASGVNSVGGLVGDNIGGTVTESYATGDVSGDDFVGGLVGTNAFGTATESYATGDVSGSSKVGGLAGKNENSIIGESYATGEISGSGPSVGGLVGKDDEDTVDNSYWDTETTGRRISAGNGTGLTTSEMTGSAATSNMVGFDFTTTWETVTNPDDYPILAWQTEDDPAPANFEVTIDSTNSPVEEGDTLTVTGTITNTGGQQDTQDITASASGLDSVTRTVMLDGGESRTETVSIPTSTGDAGSFTITVESDDDTATTTVEVESDGGGGGSVVDNYRNQNGNVDTGGLQQAINDFINQNIDTGELQAVINAFIQS